MKTKLITEGLKIKKEQLVNQLLEKCLAEQSEYVSHLETLSPKKIIDHAYEKVIRDDIILALEDDYLSPEQIKVLLKVKYPLASCYCEWLDNDCSHMEMLRDIISDFSTMLVKENQQKEKLNRKHKGKSNECR